MHRWRLFARARRGEGRRAEEKGGYALEPPHRAMTVRDLLRHTSGLVYPEMDFADPGPASEAIHALYNSKPIFESDSTLADFVAGLAAFPLAHQPGEVWEYSWGVDVLARVVEVASGEPFDEFLQTRIFDPLKMVDTGFFVPRCQARSAGRCARRREVRGSISRGRENCFPAAAASPRPRSTICASARCC